METDDSLAEIRRAVGQLALENSGQRGNLVPQHSSALFQRASSSKVNENESGQIILLKDVTLASVVMR